MKDDTFSILLLVGVILVVLYMRRKGTGAPLLSLVPSTPAPPAVAGGYSGVGPPPGVGTNYQTPPPALRTPPAPPVNAPGGAPTGIKSTFYGVTANVSDTTVQALSSLYDELKGGAVTTGCEVSGGGCLSAHDIQAAAAFDLQQDAEAKAYGRGYGH